MSRSNSCCICCLLPLFSFADIAIIKNILLR
jgi:hypothetical protein